MSDESFNGGTTQQPPSPERPHVRERKPCEHIWEYCSGPDHAANWLCSRCEAEMVAPVALQSAKAKGE